MSGGNSKMIEPIKEYFKYLFALAFYYSGSFWLMSSVKKRRKRPWPLVLMYHRIVDDREKAGLQPGIYVTKNTFEKQVAFMAKKYNILAMNQFSSNLNQGRVYSANDLIITFDDGWRDNFINTYPVLKKYNVAATIFLTVDFIGTQYLFWFQEISSLLSGDNSRNRQIADTITAVLKKYPQSPSAQKLLNENIESILADRDRFIEKLKKLDTAITYDITAETRKLFNNNPINSSDERQLLNWGEVLEMSRAGLEFGSHGLSHRLLDSLSSNDVAKELIESKKEIEFKLGKPIDSFTYPNGNYNREIESQVEKAGYTCAFIVGINPESVIKPDRYAIDRIGVHNGISISPSGKFSQAMFAWHLYRKA
jgi:peptidoglycan/xylan/chitin deacetylase (PgdA/CDA1 family)